MSTLFSLTQLQPWRLHMGEASHPGPAQFHVYSANVTGLGNKAPLLDGHTAAAWCVQETHLTLFGQKAFMRSANFRAKENHQRPWKAAWGHPCPARGCSIAGGTTTGTTILANQPIRSMLHFLPEAQTATSRITMATTRLGTLWMILASCYGYARSGNHPDHLEDTDWLLHPLAEHMLAYTHRPAILAGDMNHSLTELQAIQPLLQAGWIDLQDWMATHQGVLPQPTCKGSTRVDFMLVSPGALPYLTNGEILPDLVPTHAVLRASFSLPTAMTANQWPIPRPLPKPDGDLWIPYPMDLPPSQAYQTWWEQIEDQWPAQHINPACRGRATITAPIPRPVGQPPVPATRPGDTPTVSWHQSMHTQKAYTQLQRLQALLRLVRQRPTTNVWQRATDTWRAILQADSFPPTFALWLAQHQVIIPAEPHLPDPTWIQVGIDLLKQTYLERAQQDKQAARGIHATKMDSPAGVCRALRRAPPLSVDALADIKEATVMEVHDDPPCIILDKLINWDPNLPMIILNDHVSIGHQEQHDIFVDRTRKEWIGQTVRQIQRDESPDQTITKLAEYWAQFWNLPDLTHLADELPPLPEGTQWPELDLPAITPSLLRKHVQSLSPFAATGPDGISREDILNLSDDMLSQMMQVYNQAEATGTWPETMHHGLIRSLAKVEDAMSASHTRPIQVLSLVYRSYTSIRTKQILHLLAPRLHPSISGLSGRGPDSITWLTQQLIEMALLDQTPLMGTILDLTKAFDHLPRLPLWKHALRMGIPAYVIRAWSGAVITHQRHFQVGETTGPGQATTKGFPQGCALSCVAMVLLNDLVGLALQAATQPYTFTAYADNWQLMATSVQNLAHQTNLVGRLCARFQLPMDATKTESWGVRKQDKEEMQDTHTKIVATTKDLGFVMSYDQKHRTKIQKKRLANMDQDWHALKMCKASLKPKLLGIEIVLWRRYLHAIETSRLAPADYHTLRAKAARALGFGDAGASSWATLNLVLPRNPDPGWFALKQIVTTARKWFWFRPYTIDVWNQWLDQAHRASADGPMQALLQAFNQISWGLAPDGTAKMENGLYLHWLHVGAKELSFHLHRAWMRLTAAHLSHRQGLDTLSDPDPKETQRNYVKFGPLSTALLRKAANGTFFAKDISSHWTDDSQCPCCGNQDSAWHRLNECPATAQLRQNHWTPQEWQDLPRPLAQYGIAEVPAEVRAWQELLHNHSQRPDPAIAAPPVANHVDLFTDGASRLPSDPWLRTGAWAVVQHTLGNFDVVYAARLPGILQGSDRSEVYAIWWACQWALYYDCTISIWTDYAPAISRLGDIQDAPDASPDEPHADLWHGIIQATKQGTLTSIHKVHSHQECGGSPGDQWAWQGNDAADRQAGLALDDWLPEEEELYMPALLATEETRDKAHRAQRYLVDAANTFRTTQKAQVTDGPDAKRSKRSRGLANAGTPEPRGQKRGHDHEMGDVAPQTYDYNTGKWAQQIPVDAHLLLTQDQATQWSHAVGIDTAKATWQWLKAIWSPTTAPTWVSWQQLAILFYGVMGMMVRLPATARTKPLGQPKACGRQLPWWGEQACQLRGALRPMLKWWPWFSKAASLRPSAALRIFCTCVPVRVEAALLGQVDSLCMQTLPHGAVSTTAFRCDVPVASIQALQWPTPATDWPANQLLLK